MTKPSRKEIEQLIEDGFELELMSFEFEIPLEELEQIKKEMNDKKTLRVTERPKIFSKSPITQPIKKIKNDNNVSSDQLKLIRERYKRLFYRNYKTINMSQKKLTPEEIAIIDSSIENIEKIINGMKDITKRERRSRADNILEEINNIGNYGLNVRQAEKMYTLLQSSELYGLKLSKGDKIEVKLSETRSRVMIKLKNAIDKVQHQSNDLEELTSLRKKITNILGTNNVLITGMRIKIDNKIAKLRQQQVIEKMKNDIPVNIQNIILNLADGSLDIQMANEIIEQEANNRVKNSPKSRFALTKEQQKRQIIMQIEMALEEKTDKYIIKNPRNTIEQLNELSGENPERIVTVVVNNFVNRKKFEAAKQVYNEFAIKDDEGQISIGVTSLKKRIRNAEISDMVLRGIHMHGTEREEREYFSLIQKGIKMGNVKLEAINLGKSQDGLRTITLADIWEDTPQNQL